MGSMTLAIDFDGVLHRYTSGWRGARSIPDGAVPGAMRWLLHYIERFDVAIFTARRRHWGGKKAVRAWLIEQIAHTLPELRREGRLHLMHTVHDAWMECNYGGCKSELEEAHEAARLLVDVNLSFPLFKPPAQMLIDDRAWRFDGQFPTPREVRDFKPWNRT